MNIRDWLAERFRPKTLGERGEDVAARHLRRGGYKIVARRNRSRRGELDLVAVDDRTVVFVEVKTRRSDATGSPAEAVDWQKQRKLTRAALTYLKAHGLLEQPARFDVVAVKWPSDADCPEVEHFRDAFQAVGSKGQFYS
jgi:putative endonuclease